MKKLILILLAGSTLAFSSCTKTGPQGPAGFDGNANVIGVDRSFAVSSWSFSPTDHWYYASFKDVDITQDIVDNGVVEVFKQDPVTGSWTNLPEIVGATSTVFYFSLNGFSIYIQNSDGNNPDAPGTITFRDVIISASQRQAHPGTNWKNYNEAMAALNTTASASVMHSNVTAVVRQ